jgi:hypothetical protein
VGISPRIFQAEAPTIYAESLWRSLGINKRVISTGFSTDPFWCWSAVLPANYFSSEQPWTVSGPATSPVQLLFQERQRQAIPWNLLPL